MCKEHEYSSIGGTMIKVYFPTFPLLDTHPGALKGKITDKMAGQPDKRGDLFAEVSVVLPTHLNEEQRSLFEAFARSIGYTAQSKSA